MIRGRLRRLRGAEGHEEDQYIEIEPGELSGLFTAPGWLRDAGFTSWLLVGVVVLLVGVVWLLTLTSVIFIPLVVAGVIARVAGVPSSAATSPTWARGLPAPSLCCSRSAGQAQTRRRAWS
jgi:hypothetical protein